MGPRPEMALGRRAGVVEPQHQHAPEVGTNDGAQCIAEGSDGLVLSEAQLGAGDAGAGRAGAIQLQGLLEQQLLLGPAAGDSRGKGQRRIGPGSRRADPHLRSRHLADGSGEPRVLLDGQRHGRIDSQRRRSGRRAGCGGGSTRR